VVREDETTDRPDAVDQEKALLAQREALLRECGHRLNNSLQLISSVLALEARNSADPALQEGEHSGSRWPCIMATIARTALRHPPPYHAEARLGLDGGQ
jgi:two-component sensor histidine kinase